MQAAGSSRQIGGLQAENAVVVRHISAALCINKKEKTKMNHSLKQEVIDLLKIVGEMKKKYPIKSFTLDGRLVGDIGEIIVQENYELTLYERLEPHYDGETKSHKKVQIKTTLKDSLGFSGSLIPEYYIGIKINKDGSFEEVYNGPGWILWEYLKNRKNQRLHTIPVKKMKELNTKVKDPDRIGKRNNKNA
jgi:hypothetical protein